MRIKKKANFIVGVVDVICGIALVIACVALHRTERIVYALFPFFCGIYQLFVSVETKKQYQKRINEIKELYKLINDIKDGEQNERNNM